MASCIELACWPLTVDVLDAEGRWRSAPLASGPPEGDPDGGTLARWPSAARAARYLGVYYGARVGDVTSQMGNHLLAAHRRLVPIDHAHSCSPHNLGSTVALGFSRFVRGVKWQHQTLGAGGSVRGSEASAHTIKHGICVFISLKNR